MKRHVALGLVLSLALLGFPAGAAHTHTVSKLYASGGGVQFIGLVDTPVTPGGNYINSRTLCAVGPADFDDMGLGCIGGTIADSDHWLPSTDELLQPWSQGYTQGVAVATDLVTGPNVGFSLCLQAQQDDNTCNNFNDRRVTGCAASIVADTDDYVNRPGDSVVPGFKALYAVVFIRTIYLDLTTSTLCLSSNGSISITFAA